MKATGLPARIGYALVALPAAGTVGFYVTAFLLPKLGLGLELPAAKSEDLFRLALSVGATLAAPAFLCALTLPWRRRRHRGGRRWRLAICAATVVAASLAFAGLGHSLLYDLAFAAWLGYTLALTYVRYGLLDQKSSMVRSATAGVKDDVAD